MTHVIDREQIEQAVVTLEQLGGYGSAAAWLLWVLNRHEGFHALLLAAMKEADDHPKYHDPCSCEIEPLIAAVKAYRGEG